MPETTKKAADNPAPTPTPAQQARGNPAASGDPAVHQLLAERQTAQMNGDAAKMREVDDRLAELGFGR